MSELVALTRRLGQLGLELSALSLPTLDAGTDQQLPEAWVRRLLHDRAKLASRFGPGLFGDPAFELLLDLFASEQEGKDVSVTAACSTSGVPPTTALRWIGLLQSRGLLERHQDCVDGRRTFLRLSRCARSQVDAWIADISTRWVNSRSTEQR